jgi:hypothetical protein
MKRQEKTKEADPERQKSHRTEIDFVERAKGCHKLFPGMPENKLPPNPSVIW